MQMLMILVKSQEIFNADAVTDFEEIPLAVNRNNAHQPVGRLCPRSKKTVCRATFSGKPLPWRKNCLRSVFDHQVLALFFPKRKHTATSDSIGSQQPQSI
jgi:hypothetical protein